MECPSCQRMFSRRDVMLRHHRNKHGTSVPPPPPQNATQESFRFQHPFTMIVSGPTSCGKTFFREGSIAKIHVQPGAGEDRLAVPTMATPLRRDSKDGGAHRGIRSRYPDRVGSRSLLRCTDQKLTRAGRPDVDLGQRPSHQRLVHGRIASSEPVGGGCESEPVFREGSDSEEKLSLPGPLRQSSRSPARRHATSVARSRTR
ncbi:Hypothetical predicted protein [Mytilus galloprovincialis]|uniref:C2H2-type domain-containing protein n=1 Tax=Mytilus galloprovincialis TaxID=29158 RepID=A0A8B6ELL8_MYTGA|nr:Hypothetical predicted protein [Mytilus galloprovincialis]